MIHLVLSRSGVNACEGVVEADDIVVFLGDGVRVGRQIGSCACYSHDLDLRAYGVVEPKHDDRPTPISMSEIVDFICAHPNSATWK